MKKLSAFIILFLCGFTAARSQINKTSVTQDSTYAIIELAIPGTKLEEITINIFYGENRIENIGYVPSKNRYNISSVVADALNYLKGKGYSLDQTLKISKIGGETIQYIMKKESPPKISAQ